MQALETDLPDFAGPQAVRREISVVCHEETTGMRVDSLSKTVVAVVPRGWASRKGIKVGDKLWHVQQRYGAELTCSQLQELLRD